LASLDFIFNGKLMAENTEHTKNPWTTLSGEVRYDNPWINVTEFQVLNPSGGKGIYGKVHFKNKAIGVIPVDDQGNTWLVGQFRYTLNAFSWEIPEGGGPDGTDPLDSAKRELREETGLTAGKWTLISRLHTSNSVTDEEGFIFLAEDLTSGKSDLEDTEADLQTRKIPLKEAIDLVLRGDITDSMSIIGLLIVARMKGL
jgi:8-oxo-dGTP pyrophosphatase MutT (NUDIX family)